MGDSWIAIVVALIAAVPGVYAVIANLRKNRAEATDSISDAAVQLVEPLRCENVTLRQQVTDMQQEIDQVRKEIGIIRVENATLRGDITQLRDDNATLRTAIAALRAENEELVEGVAALTRQVETLGQRPVYGPRKR